MGWAEKYPDGGVVDYDPAWREKYLDVHGLLTAALGTDWAMEHAGSTSVPGLCAKPVIDVVLRLPEPWAMANATRYLTDAGWTAPIVVGDHWATFFPQTGPRAAIGHIFTAEQWPTAHMRLFAHWLRRHAEDRQRYAHLKQGLLANGIWDAGYTDGKAHFVRDIVNRVRRERRLPPVNGAL
jgi:GrpB-like predicted nucleotidyltransferase (UPF0157 family)